MKILISSYGLELSGVPTYTLILHNELVKRGHNVYIYSPKSGPLAEKMNVHTHFENLETPDVILAQANKCAIWMKGAYPKVPMVFIGHGVLPDLEQPPRIPIDRYIAVNEEIVVNFIGQYVDPIKIDIVRDFVNTEIFAPLKPIRKKPRVLLISNYKKWKTYDFLAQACANLKLEFRAVGSPYGKSNTVEKEINEADLIVGKGRCLLEAMSCGRTVLSCNELYGDGYLTVDRYMESRQRNFGGYQCRYYFDVERFMTEIKRYTASDGEVNRKLILQYHEVKKGVDEIIDVIDKIRQ